MRIEAIACLLLALLLLGMCSGPERHSVRDSDSRRDELFRCLDTVEQQNHDNLDRAAVERQVDACFADADI